MSESTCNECGGAIPAESPGGFCAQCLFGLGFQQDHSKQPQPPTEKLGDRIGRYRLLQEIGHGGCGVVYLAEQEEPVHRKVALKVIKLGMDTRQVVARFEAERQALALMDHPNIAKVHDAGATDTGRPYFVMELVGGSRMTDYCDQHSMSLRERLDLFIQVCRAIQHAHQKGVIHRDIKPSNVLVATQDGVPVPKVIDFGIAKATQGRLTDQTLFTAFEQFLGTPAYMSPEQAQLGSLDVDTRSDIYSLGVLLYELLTGTTPFDTRELVAAGLDEMRRTIREVDPVRPSTRLTQTTKSEVRGPKSEKSEIGNQKSAIPTDLDWIVMKCLEKDRSRRYETANGLASDLQRHLNNEPVVARPPSKLYELQKTVRRHTFGFIATGVIILLLAVGALLSTWQAIRATRAEREQHRLRELGEKAQANESRERLKAQTEAARSQQVSQFLKDMLEGVGPSVARGRDTTMLREILTKTALRLDSELAHQPEVQADLRTTLGVLYEQLGDLTNASTQLQIALNLRQGLYGEHSTSVADSLEKLASVLAAEGRLAEAEASGRKALALWTKLLPAGHIRLADSRSNLGQTLFQEGKYAEAEGLIREALATKRNLLGDTNLSVAGSLLGLAQVLDNLGKYEEAERLAREGLVIHKWTHGYDDPAVGHLFDTLGMALERSGKFSEAEKAYREGLDVRRRLLGDGHPDLGWSWLHIGYALAPQDRLAEAEAAYREGLAIRQRAPSSAHTGVAYAFAGLAQCLRRAGKIAEEEKTYREWLTWAQKSDDSRGAVSALGGLGRCLRAQGKYAEADYTFHECLDRVRQSGDRAGLAVALNDLAWMLVTLPDSTRRDGTNAIGLALEAVSVTGSTNPVYLDTLAATYACAGDFSKAVSIQKEAIALVDDERSSNQGYAARLKLFESGRPYRDHGTLAARVVDLLAAGRFGDAEPLARDCLAIRELEIAGDWRTFNTQSMLGGSLLGQGKHDEAEPLLLSGYQGMQQPGRSTPPRPRIKEAIERLIQLYEATSRPAHAASWKKSLEEFEKSQK